MSSPKAIMDAFQVCWHSRSLTPHLSSHGNDMRIIVIIIVNRVNLVNDQWNQAMAVEEVVCH
jgi:hypothetical protein